MHPRLIINIQDGGLDERDGRFVVPIKPTYKRTVGIVHDTSRTGRTLYVEPMQVNLQISTCRMLMYACKVVESTNQLRQMKNELRDATHRILSEMCLIVGKHRVGASTYNATASGYLNAIRAWIARNHGGSARDRVY
jgi:DNA mismatch repair protein MutS2